MGECVEFALSKDVAPLVDVLRFFAKTRSFTLLDRLGFALSPHVAKEALTEALRVLRSLRGSALVVRAKSGDEVREVVCCEWDRPEDGRCPYGYERVEVVDVVEGPRDLSIVCCVRCPREPSEDVVGKAMECLEGGEWRNFTRILVARALSIPGRLTGRE